MLTKRSLFFCCPNSVSHHDASPCLIEMNWSFLFSFLHVSSHLHFPSINFITRFGDSFFTEMVSNFPRHHGEDSQDFTIAGMLSGLQWTENVFILKAQLWTSDFMFCVANEITTFMSDWGRYCTLKSDMKQLCLTWWLPLTKGFPPQFTEICME